MKWLPAKSGFLFHLLRKTELQHCKLKKMVFLENYSCMIVDILKSDELYIRNGKNSGILTR